MLYLWACYLLAFILFLIPWPKRRKVDLKDRARRMNMLRQWRREKIYVGRDMFLTRRVPYRDREE